MLFFDHVMFFVHRDLSLTYFKTSLQYIKSHYYKLSLDINCVIFLYVACKDEKVLLVNHFFK